MEIRQALDKDAADFAERTRLELESAAADVSMRRMFNVLKPLYKPAQQSAAGVKKADGTVTLSACETKREIS